MKKVNSMSKNGLLAKTIKNTRCLSTRTAVLNAVITITCIIMVSNGATHGVMFSTSAFLQSLELHYKTGTLWHSDASILFTSAKVPSASAILQKQCAPCEVPLLMPTCHFLNGWCLVGACFLGLLHSFSPSSVPRSHLLPWALFT